MANVARVQLETDRPGLVQVKAKPAPGREMDAKPIAGFFVVRRYAGDVFAINDWREFSPRWMEFVDENKVPKDWWDKLKIREDERSQFIAKATEENKKTPAERMRDEMFSMFQAGNPQLSEIDTKTGGVRPRGSKPTDGV